MIFKIEKKLQNSLGRVGIIETAHGIIHTPAFVAVGTKGTVKSLNPEQVRDAGTQVVLGNTYHLYLQPGDEIVRDAGGLGKIYELDRSDDDGLRGIPSFFSWGCLWKRNFKSG